MEACDSAWLAELSLPFLLPPSSRGPLRAASALSAFRSAPSALLPHTSLLYASSDKYCGNIRRQVGQS